ncbi:hypothetical protein BLOT_001968 [Blomia tropicalis]|nr:hypothetical protein BLOT_001968 [Blomia tropicalis]
MLDELQTEKERWTMLLSPDSRGGGGRRRRRQRENELVFSSCIDLTPQVSAMQPKSGVYATTPLRNLSLRREDSKKMKKKRSQHQGINQVHYTN